MEDRKRNDTYCAFGTQGDFLLPIGHRFKPSHCSQDGLLCRERPLSRNRLVPTQGPERSPGSLLVLPSPGKG